MPRSRSNPKTTPRRRSAAPPPAGAPRAPRAKNRARLPAATWCAATDEAAPPFEAPECEEELGIPALFPLDEASACAPRGAVFIGAVAWSFRPGSERRDGFFLAPSDLGEWRWVLWAFRYDDNWEVWSWVPRAATTREFKSEKEAASFLMRMSWLAERANWNSSLFGEVEDAGLLSTEELFALGEETLGEPSNDDEVG